MLFRGGMAGPGACRPQTWWPQQLTHLKSSKNTETAKTDSGKVKTTKQRTRASSDHTELPMPELLGKPPQQPSLEGALIPGGIPDRKCGGGWGFPSQDRCVRGKETGLPKPTGARKEPRRGSTGSQKTHGEHSGGGAQPPARGA